MSTCRSRTITTIREDSIEKLSDHLLPDLYSGSEAALT
jgi:hypothetical protein